jgi:hypothetical protein
MDICYINIMKDLIRDIVRFFVTLAPFVYVVFWMNANPWWIALGTFLYMFVIKHSQPEIQEPTGCKRKTCCKQKNSDSANNSCGGCS